MILDSNENFELSPNEGEKHYEELMALSRLGEGLDWIYRQIKVTEKKLCIEAQKDNIICEIVGPLTDSIPKGLISSAFQWYAVSICNYVQLIGWIHYGSKEKASEYEERVLPKLLRFRNKVAAHFALVNPKKEDNIADLRASINTQVIFAYGRFLAGSVSELFEDENQNEIKITKNLVWSLTDQHERLIPRYWKNGITKSYQAIQMPGKSTKKLTISWEGLFGDEK
jgi:hypothetical protein